MKEDEIDRLIDKLIEASREHGATWHFGQDDVETEAKANMQATRAALRAAIAAKDAEIARLRSALIDSTILLRNAATEIGKDYVGTSVYESQASLNEVIWKRGK